MLFSQKPKTFFEFFIAFQKSGSNFEYFKIKDEALKLSISEIIDPKIRLVKSLKGPVSEEPSLNNMLTGPKDC